MKHFIIEITYLIPFGTFDEIIPEHRNFLQAGYENGLLLCSGPQNPTTGGIVVARAVSREKLEEFFLDDPYQKKKIAQYRILEFSPVKHQSFLKEWVEGI